MVCPPVPGDNPQALASGLLPVQADKPWYNYHRYRRTNHGTWYNYYKIVIPWFVHGITFICTGGQTKVHAITIIK